MRECEDCGSPYDPPYRNKNAKYCRVCQVLRTVLYYGERGKACWLCEKKFGPLMSSQTVCPTCRPYTTKHSATGECSFCKATRDDLLGEDVLVCAPCACDPKNRRVLAKALLKKQTERKAA